MKQLKIFMMLFAGICLSISCKKELSVDSLNSFKVYLDSNEFKVGDPVVFKFEGEADYISIYTGEVGRDYEFWQGREVEVGNIKLSFNSSSASGAQQNQFSILISNDFDGDYSDLENIKTYTWTDISSRFTLGNTATLAPSGVVNLSEFKVPEKPIYIAYKYISKPQIVNGLGKTWTVTGFSLSGETSVGDRGIADMYNSGFRIIDPHKDYAPAQSGITTTRFTFLSNEYSDELDPETEHWAISKAIHTDTLNLGKDKPVIVKGFATSGVKQYRHSYSKSGIYTVYVVAFNQNVYDNKQHISKLEIKVE